MPHMPLYEVAAENLNKIEQTSFDAAGLRERTDLQRLLRKQIDVILPDTLIISEEFGEWEESKRRIDLLGLDKQANLVVIELKRTDDGGHMELQAVRYAAMVSTMTFEKAVQIYGQYLARNNDETNARESILEFLDWDEANDDLFGQDVRIILVSANFSKELTTAVMWLNKRDLEIRCVRLVPYQHGSRTLIDVQQVIPLPEATEYQVQIREKEQKERKVRAEGNQLNYKFWQGLLAMGKAKSALHENISPTASGSLGIANVGGNRLYYVINRNDGRVEYYINRGDQKLNKDFFDALLRSREEIETSFGSPLSWERLDSKVTCRIAFHFERGYKSDESEWADIQETMIDAMIRLEGAIAPVVLRILGN